MKPYTRIIDSRLIEAIKNRTCVLFVGSGLSSEAITPSGTKLPGWEELLRRLLQLAQDEGIEFTGGPSDIKRMIETHNYLMAAQELQDIIPRPSLGKFLRTILGGAAPVDIHKIIPLLPFRAVITSNYDTLLEGGYAFVQNGVLPSIKTQADLRTDRPSLRFGGEFFIFKLHGHIDRPDTIVLGTQDYQKLIFDFAAYRQFLETLFSAYTVLFVGFGATDPDLLNVLDKLTTFSRDYPEKHYILLPDNRYTATEKRRITKDLGLIGINYEVGSILVNGKSAEDHSQVTEFFRAIKDQLYREIVTSAPPELEERAKKCKVFIISSPKDTGFSNSVASELQKKLGEESVWLTSTMKSEFEEAEAFIPKIAAEALQNASYIIIIVSNYSMRSSVTDNEVSLALDYARSSEIDILVTNISDSETPDALKAFPSYSKRKSEWKKADFNHLAGLIIPQPKQVQVSYNFDKIISTYFTTKADFISYSKDATYFIEPKSSFILNKELEWFSIQTLLPLLKTTKSQSVDGKLLGLKDDQVFVMPPILRIVETKADYGFDYILESDNENWGIRVVGFSPNSDWLKNFLRERETQLQDIDYSQIWVITKGEIRSSIHNKLYENRILHSGSSQFIQLLQKLLAKPKTLP